jgi:hypothetical protein
MNRSPKAAAAAKWCGWKTWVEFFVYLKVADYELTARVPSDEAKPMIDKGFIARCISSLISTSVISLTPKLNRTSLCEPWSIKMKKVLLSAAISATLGLTALPSMAKDVDLRMSWWGGNGRHQVTLKALEEFQQNPDINVKAEYTGWDGHFRA